MATITQETRFELFRDELITLSAAKNHVVSCNSGQLWITLDGERQDIILAPGETYRIDSAATVSISALKAATLKAATLEVRHQEAFGPRASGARRLLVSLLNWEFPALASLPSTLIR